MKAKGPRSLVKYATAGTRPPHVTTKALGEEGGSKPPPDVTTKALGEEGGSKPPPDVTTLAVGEEGGSSR